jgi:CheY-like chemotaxis protein
MNAIMGFSGLLASKDVGPEKQNLYAQIIKRRSTDLLKIIDDILDISKIEANQIEIKESTGNVNSMLDELHDYFLNKKEVDNKSIIDIKISNQLNNTDAQIVTDFGRLKQVLFNLTENALKFTEKGIIEISCMHESNNMLHFRVKDTGIGIDPSMHEVIFHRFRQAHDHSIESVSGTGLGLAISKGLVELMGGKIWMTSEPKRGSEFHFTIPKKLQGQINESTEEQSIVNENLDGKTILIVEDDEINTHFLREVLEMAQAITINAHYGKTSIDILKNAPSVDAILLDIKLPDINGLDLIEQYRKICPGIVIVIQSAYATNDDIEAGYSAGCDAYLTKPTDANLLVATIIGKINRKK